MDEILTSTITPGLSGTGSNGNTVLTSYSLELQKQSHT